jgi:hypothetical protein
LPPYGVPKRESRGPLEAAMALIKAGGEALLLITANDGFFCLRIEIYKALIKAGGEALLDKAVNDGRSCLYAACQHGHLEVAQALIKAGGEALLPMFP